MSVSSRTSYPKALPFQSPEDVAAQAKLGEELAAQAKRLQQRSDDLSAQAARLRRWTLGLIAGSTLGVLLAVGAVAGVIKHLDTLGQTPSIVPNTAAPSAPDLAPAPAGNPSLPTIAVKPAPSTLPAQAIAKPDLAPTHRSDLLEALGGLSATHLYQSHLNIGLLADAVESEIYTIEDAEKSLSSVVELMKLVDAQLAKVAKAGIDAGDQESIRELQAVTAMLHMQAGSLRSYWATGQMEHAEQYHKAREAASQGLAKILDLDS